MTEAEGFSSAILALLTRGTKLDFFLSFVEEDPARSVDFLAIGTENALGLGLPLGTDDAEDDGTDLVVGVIFGFFAGGEGVSSS